MISSEELLALIRLEQDGVACTRNLAQTNLAEISSSHIQHNTTTAIKQTTPKITASFLKLRERLKSGVKWSELVQSCLQIARTDHQGHLIAYTIEIAFLSATPEQIHSYLLLLGDQVEKVFAMIHPHIRASLIRKIVNFPSYKTLSDYLQTTPIKNRTPLEHLVLFEALVHLDNHKAYPYFNEHRIDLFEAANLLDRNSPTPKETNLLWLNGAKAAARNGFGEEVLSLIDGIDQKDIATFQAGLALAQQAGSTGHKSGSNPFAQAMHRINEEKVQIKMFKYAFEQLKENPASLSSLHFCNWLKAPFEDLLPNSQVWRSFSEHLIAQLNTQLTDIQTALLQPFQAIFYRTYNMRLNIAFWSPLLGQPSASQSQLEKNLLAVANFQLFLSDPLTNELIFWDAFFCLYISPSNSDLPLSWTTLTKYAFNYLNDSHMPQQQDVLIRSSLACAVEFEKLTAVDINSYLDCSINKPHWILSRFETFLAQNKEGSQTHLRTLLALSQRRYLPNHQLANIVIIAQHKQRDLSWRTLSILASRHALPHQLEHLWSLSGEKRSNVPIRRLRHADIKTCIEGLSDNWQIFLTCLLEVGPAIPALIASSSRNVAWIHSKQRALGPECMHIASQTLPSKWLEQMSGSYRIKLHGQWCTAANLLPQNRQDPPPSQWISAFRFWSHYLGIHSWSWDIKILARTCRTFKESQHKTTSSSWIRSLNISQKSAWLKLIGQLPHLASDQACDILIAVCARLATMSIQQHHTALESIRVMTGNLNCIHLLESFILSEPYGTFRKNGKTETLVDMPTSIPTILEENYSDKRL